MANKKSPITLDLNDVDVDIKMAPKNKAKDKKPERPIIPSPLISILGQKVKVADKAIEISKAIENSERELEDLEEILIKVALEEKKQQEKNGNFAKTIDILGTEYRVQVQIKDAYGKMDSDMGIPLRKIFEEKYPILFQDMATVTLKTEKTEELKKILGDRFSDFFNVERFVKPSSEFQQSCFSLKNSFNDKQTIMINKVLSSCQSTPAVKYPK